MASKVLVPAAPFAKLQVKKSPPEASGSGFIIGGGDPAARVAHLEHSVRFLQEQHRLMLSGLHTEIEALRERNRDLQFQLIFNKESSSKSTSPPVEENSENEDTRLKREVTRLEREAAAARGEARAADARALQLQRLIDAQAEKVRELEAKAACSTCAAAGSELAEESRGELRARLADAERLVRRLRADAERQRREVLAVPATSATSAPGGAVTNLLFDGAHATHAHLQCMKNSLHASLRATGLDGGYGYQNNYHFPPVHTPEFWREPIREDYLGSRGRNPRLNLTLPELSGHQIHRSTVYANNHTRPRANGYEKKKPQPPANGDAFTVKASEDTQPESRSKTIRTSELSTLFDKYKTNRKSTRPELKLVVTKFIPHGHVSSCPSAGVGVGAGAGAGAGVGAGAGAEARARVRRHPHRKHASTDHT